MLQFQTLQKDVADAILTDVEQRRWDKIDEYGLRELVDEHPSLEKILLERKGGDDGEMSLRRLHPQGVLGGVINKDTVAHVLHYTIDKTMPEPYLKWAAKDKGMLALRKHFQDKITKGEFVDNYIRRQLQASRLTYNKYGDGDDFDYFSNPNSKNPIVNLLGGGGKPPEPVEEQGELSKEVEFQVNYISKSLGISKDRARQMLKEQEKSPMSIQQNKDTLTDD